MHPPTPSPDELGVHAVFLRRLAEALLRSPDLADDAVQETLLLAWRKRPRGPHPRGWLVRTLENVARNMRRASGRRTRHEGKANAFAMTTPEAIRARERTRKTLIDAVLALPEEERECILLRYDQGLPARQIAAALALPPHTVQNRLRRGRVRLRASLARTHGASPGDETAWRAGLLALVPRVTPAAGGTGLLGGLLVSKIAWTAAAALLLLGLGWMLMDPGAQPEPREDARQAPSSAELAAANGGSPTLRTTAAPNETDVSAPAVEALHLHGTVYAADGGTPLPGARVVAFAYARQQRLETVTDEAGRFAFEDTRGDRGAFHVRAELAPFAAGEASRVRATRDGVDLHLARGGVLHGVVVTRDARPERITARAIVRRARPAEGGPMHKLVGAALPAGFTPAVEVPVDPDTGAFELGPLHTGRHALELRVEGRPPFLVVPPETPYRWEAGFDVAAGARVDVGEVLLPPDETLRVHLIDARTEETIRHARFLARTEGDPTQPVAPMRVRPDEATGMFHVPATATGKGRLALDAVALVPGYARADIDVSGTWGTRPLVVRMHRPSSLLLRVSQPAEAREPQIAFVRRSSDEIVLAVTPLEHDVAVEVPDLPAGVRLELLVFDAALDGRRHVASFVLEPGEQKTLELGGDKRTAVAGTVRQGGTPVGDVLVAVDDASGTRIRIWTGQDGRFRIDDLAPGPASVFFNLGEERAMVRRRIEVQEGRVHDASVDLAVPVRGSVRLAPEKNEKDAAETDADAEKRKTLPDLALISEGGLVISVRPAADGSFATWVPRGGIYTLGSNESGYYVVEPVSVTVHPDDTAPIEVEVARDPGDGTIDITILDAATRKRIPDVTAHFSGPQVSGVSSAAGVGHQKLDDLELGRYRVQLVAPGYVSGERQVALTLEDRHREFQIELHASEAVRVDSFATGSRAKEAGLQVGDLLRSYAGKPVTSITTLRAAMQGKQPSELVVVEIRRGDQELRLDLPAGRLGIFGTNARLPE